MSELSRYEPAFLSACTHPNYPGNFDVKGEIKFRDASVRCYSVTTKENLESTGSDRTEKVVLVTTDIYDALDETFTPGQQVVVTVSKINPRCARNLRSLTEKEKAEGQTESSQSQVGQGGSSQSQAPGSHKSNQPPR